MTELYVDVSVASDDTFYMTVNGEEIELTRESFQAFVAAMDSMAEKKPGSTSSFAFGVYDEDEEGYDE